VNRMISSSVVALLFCLTIHKFALAHDLTKRAFLQAQRAAEQKANEANRDSRVDDAAEECRLDVELIDAKTLKPLAGLIRITDVETSKPLKLAGLIARENNWYSVGRQSRIVLRQKRLKVEAIQGLETRLTTESIDLKSISKATLRLPLTRVLDAAEHGLQSGNTHLHLMRLTHAEAIEYLDTVPRSDGLDLVFLSHLRRIPDEKTYVSNAIVESDIGGGGELKRLSQDGLLYANGEEHRHNFGRGSEGYGHVMLLDLTRLIRPVSIGPGIMRDGHDGIPLRRGIERAREDGGTVIWCHNTFGFEDVPNWTAGVLHAQNIFDGGTRGSYEDSFYRYLNIGLKVPFSTGTDWFIYDFSRVYVPIKGKLTSKKWLEQLRQGRTFITNGPFLKFQVDDSQIGDTIKLSDPKEMTMRGSAIGRSDFGKIELIFNGKVIAQAKSDGSEEKHDANLTHRVVIREPGWLALRIALDAGKNVFGKPMFAHTSPIYVEYDGKRIFRPEVASELITEIQGGVTMISEKGVFRSETDKESVLGVHQEAIKQLEQRVMRRQKPKTP
jgi:hypothetical protein